jgi:hypothetical protein
MAIVKIEGKSITVPDEIAALGKEAVRNLLSQEFPAIENAQIEIVKEEGAPAVITVTKRATPKGQVALTQALLQPETRPMALEQSQLIDALRAAPPYVNPAIALTEDVMRAEMMGDREFFEAAARRGDVERAISESNNEGQAVADALFLIGHALPTTSDEVPVGF